MLNLTVPGPERFGTWLLFIVLGSAVQLEPTPASALTSQYPIAS